MRLQWREAVSFPSDSVWPGLLDGLLEPVAEDRLTAAQAQAVLRGEKPQGRRTTAVASAAAQQVGRWEVHGGRVRELEPDRLSAG